MGLSEAHSLVSLLLTPSETPPAADKDDFPFPDTTATTSLIDTKQSNVNGNGIFNGGLSGALNTDRAKLFKKANSSGRPVREWYV